jgi:hypothetical protein
MKTMSVFDTEGLHKAHLRHCASMVAPVVRIEDHPAETEAVKRFQERISGDVFTEDELRDTLTVILKEKAALEKWKADYDCEIHCDALGSWTTITFERDADHDRFAA